MESPGIAPSLRLNFSPSLKFPQRMVLKYQEHVLFPPRLLKNQKFVNPVFIANLCNIVG